MRKVSEKYHYDPQSPCDELLFRCRNGRLHGKCWKFLPGGGALYGNVGVDDKITGDDVVYLYPDFLTAIKVHLLLDSHTAQMIFTHAPSSGSFQG